MTRAIGQTHCKTCDNPLSPRTTSGICSTCAWHKRQVKARAVVEAARRAPCLDCGVVDAARSEFDHVPERGPKKFNIGNGAGKSLGILAREMAKCDLLCQECHYRRTVARGQTRPPPSHPGELNHTAVLTAESVHEIRERASRGATQSSLALTFKVSQMQISRIVRRVDWKHI